MWPRTSIWKNPQTYAYYCDLHLRKDNTSSIFAFALLAHCTQCVACQQDSEHSLWGIVTMGASKKIKCNNDNSWRCIIPYNVYGMIHRQIMVHIAEGILNFEDGWIVALPMGFFFSFIWFGYDVYVGMLFAAASAHASLQFFVAAPVIFLFSVEGAFP